MQVSVLTDASKAFGSGLLIIFIICFLLLGIL